MVCPSSTAIAAARDERDQKQQGAYADGDHDPDSERNTISVGSAVVCGLMTCATRKVRDVIAQNDLSNFLLIMCQCFYLFAECILFRNFNG